ncbi:type II toxin-antitoxin system Phd/YefM family antitoxin [Tundrisphaera sp. TA3]|uniref:type II toxin-antitoxin system Phd/YefM family antitoxin n=1 Tax=Tundrisphaera sp. TA3 TaxID=3435775 RepID=UPI003EC0249B
MTTITVEDAQARLPELIDGLSRGEQVLIVRGDRVVACLSGDPSPPSDNSGQFELERNPGPWPCKAGSERSDKFWMAPDFDEPLEDFREYME